MPFTSIENLPPPPLGSSKLKKPQYKLEEKPARLVQVKMHKNAQHKNKASAILGLSNDELRAAQQSAKLRKASVILGLEAAELKNLTQPKPPTLKPR